MTSPTYVWAQTPSTITILIDVTPSTTGDDVYVKVNDGKLAIKLFGNTIVEGQLQGQVLKDQGIWLLEEKRLIVHIRKRGKKLWPALLIDESASLPETKTIHGPLSDAQILIGRCYEEGENGLKKEYETSLECHVSAAELGNLISQLRVAFIYHAGRHYKQFPIDESTYNDVDGGDHITRAKTRNTSYIDPEEGFRFHMMAAVQHNHVEALYNVANSYFQGVGVKKDHKKAAEYYMRAAELIPPLAEVNGKKVAPRELTTEMQQSLLSMFHLGLIYSQGEDGMERSAEEAFKWWRKASKYKHPQSIYNMGVMLLSNGSQTPQDIILAFLYLKEANSLQPDLVIPEGFHFLEENLKMAAKEQNMSLDELLTKMRQEVEDLEAEADKEMERLAQPAGRVAVNDESNTNVNVASASTNPVTEENSPVIEEESAEDEDDEQEVPEAMAVPENVLESSRIFWKWGAGVAVLAAIGYIGIRLYRKR